MATARPVTVKTDLDDVFVFRHMSGREELSCLFEYRVELLAEDDRIILKDLLGKGVTIDLGLGEGAKRHFHGIVSQFSFAGTEGIFARYELTLVPWLWFLGRTHDLRIFQEKTAVEIVKEIFGKYGEAEFEDKLTGSYATREYCVQYRESDLDFVSRLLQAEGITYYFKHEEGKHTLVLADATSCHGPFEGYEEVPYFPRDDLARRERDHLYGLVLAGEVQPGAYVHTAFDFKKPKADLQAKLEKPMPHELAAGEVYDYPGPHVELDHGDVVARTRLEELLARHERVEGEGTAAGLCAGHSFKLTQHPRDDQNRDYLITSVQHEIWEDAYRSRSSGGDEEVYLCRFQAMPNDRPYRPACRAPKPFVHGPQTAIVTGPGGEEIWCDRYGRVKLQFHWDRLGKKDENSSCWVRVSQAWAGGSWGGIHIPRIGQEVVVDFLEGDPDRPLITGRVYNGGTMPPYDLPGSATQSGIKSNSSKGGGGWNELRFEDKKGAEEVYIQAEKDENILVKNDKSETVGHDETISIGNDRGEEVGHDETLAVGNNRSRTVGVDEGVTVGSNQSISVGSNQTIAVGSNRDDKVGSNETRLVGQIHSQTVGLHRNITVAVNQTHQVGGNRSAVVGGNDSRTVAGNRSADVGGGEGLSVGKGRASEIGDDDVLKVGKDQSVTVGKKLTINAGDEITIVTGQASIVMKKDGTISIKGKDIKIEGSGKIDVKASKNVTIKGQQIHQN